jgi:gamma-glutamyl:cysteine ligase YbdK (ATP-grasp superfamily)
MKGSTMFSFGIEHEIVFLNQQSQFVDWENTSYTELDSIIAKLPLYEDDFRHLRLGDAGIKKKRWYIEGFERYNTAGKVIDCPPKGIEIRTTIHSTIQDAVGELTESFQRLYEEAKHSGYHPVLCSFHPYHSVFTPDPPLNEYEQKRKLLSPEKRTAFIPMLTYGPDLNLSLQGMSVDEIIDFGRKLTYYSPCIIPFSFSSPFYEGILWEGLSARTWVRTGARPAAMVFLAEQKDLISSDPSLTKPARLPAEVGRIEFKACDSCADFALYAGLLALLKGLLLDQALAGRATVPDTALHQLSARHGFNDEGILHGAQAVLQAAERALRNDADSLFLEPLRVLLQRRETPAHTMIERYKATGSIEETLRGTYQSFLSPMSALSDTTPQES